MSGSNNKYSSTTKTITRPTPPSRQWRTSSSTLARWYTPESDELTREINSMLKQYPPNAPIASAAGTSYIKRIHATLMENQPTWNVPERRTMKFVKRIQQTAGAGISSSSNSNDNSDAASVASSSRGSIRSLFSMGKKNKTIRTTSSSKAAPPPPAKGKNSVSTTTSAISCSILSQATTVSTSTGISDNASNTEVGSTRAGSRQQTAAAAVVAIQQTGIGEKEALSSAPSTSDRIHKVAQQQQEEVAVVVEDNNMGEKEEAVVGVQEPMVDAGSAAEPKEEEEEEPASPRSNDWSAMFQGGVTSSKPMEYISIESDSMELIGESDSAPVFVDAKTEDEDDDDENLCLADKSRQLRKSGSSAAEHALAAENVVSNAWTVLNQATEHFFFSRIASRGGANEEQGTNDEAITGQDDDHALATTNNRSTTTTSHLLDLLQQPHVYDTVGAVAVASIAAVLIGFTHSRMRN